MKIFVYRASIIIPIGAPLHDHSVNKSLVDKLKNFPEVFENVERPWLGITRAVIGEKGFIVEWQEV